MSRRNIYYWKCDRPAAFHGTQSRGVADAETEQQLRAELCRHFDAREVMLSVGAGQGNHLTWNAEIDGESLFVRVENGPEHDEHLAVESLILDRVREVGVATPRVKGCDASRSRVPFAWQVMERIPFPDLNHWYKQGDLDAHQIAFDIGEAVARWQFIKSRGFGPLDGQQLQGLHSNYADYFNLRLDDHLAFLVAHHFFTTQQRGEIETEIKIHRSLLNLDEGCLVHKDLALWNILGSENHIAAFIDFDDAIHGDPLDDLSLLACFHDAPFVQRAFEGYQSHRALAGNHLRRFWLHLLRNMIVKAVIRVGAGYFDRDDGFFLIGSGASGTNLRETTHAKIDLALRGLREEKNIDILSP